MDRRIVYPSSIPLDTDILGAEKNALLGLGYALQDILGPTTVAAGLACTPTGPATMQVQIAPGRIYSLQNVDNTAYGSIAADTTHQVMKQGISMDSVLLSCPAPSTAGFSINYLIEAAYSDVDGQAIVLNYYNSANPTVPFSGPANTGASQATVRQGTIVLTAKPGTAATTGTQTTPSADSGNIGLFVVIVAQGQTTIISGNITQLPGAAFIGPGGEISATGLVQCTSGMTTTPSVTAKFFRIGGMAYIEIPPLTGTGNTVNTLTFAITFPPGFAPTISKAFPMYMVLASATVASSAILSSTSLTATTVPAGTNFTGTCGWNLSIVLPYPID